MKIRAFMLKAVRDWITDKRDVEFSVAKLLHHKGARKWIVTPLEALNVSYYHLPKKQARWLASRDLGFIVKQLLDDDSRRFRFIETSPRHYNI
jgi:hypothetical protein